MKINKYTILHIIFQGNSISIMIFSAAITIALGAGLNAATYQDDAKVEKRKNNPNLIDKNGKDLNAGAAADHVDKKAKGRAGVTKKKAAFRVPTIPPQNLKANPNLFFDPLLAASANLPRTPFHFRIRARSSEMRGGATFSYYPSRLGTKTSPIIMIHERSQSPIDFETPIKDLNETGLAQSMQKAGYAVLVVDLRGSDFEFRQPIGAIEREPTSALSDLQIAYLFLLDRHNRAELNLSNLGVLALGDGCNLAVAWASARGAAVSSADRGSDIASMALISPRPDLFGSRIQIALASLAARIPLFLAAGERDAPSAQVVRDTRNLLARIPQSKTEIFPTSLQAYKLMRLWPKVASATTKFFDSTTKFRGVDWEPRYNLSPLDYQSVEATPNIPPKTPAAFPEAK